MSQNPLFEVANQARLKSHSPYSNVKVGAAIRTRDGRVLGGCNIENSSFGGTVCAERVAIWKALSETGSLEIAEVYVVTDTPDAWPPCGLCRQVIAEFVRDDIPVHSSNLKGKTLSMKFSELLPHAFTPAYLAKK